MKGKKHLREWMAATAGLAVLLVAGLLLLRSQAFDSPSVRNNSTRADSPETLGAQSGDSNRAALPAVSSSRGSSIQTASNAEAVPVNRKPGSAGPDESIPVHHDLPLYDDSENSIKTALPCWAFQGNAPDEFVVATDERTRTSGASSATLEAGLTSGWGSLHQFSSAQGLRGRRVEFSVDMRTVAVALRASIFVRADDSKGNVVALDNMWFNYVGDTKDPHRLNRSLSGDNEWTTERVVLDIPPEAATLSYGATLEGAGKVWIDNAHLEAVGSDTPITSIVRPARLLQQPAFSPTKTPPSPRNLDFERDGFFKGTCD